MPTRWFRNRVPQIRSLECPGYNREQPDVVDHRPRGGEPRVITDHEAKCSRRVGCAAPGAGEYAVYVSAVTPLSRTSAN